MLLLYKWNLAKGDTNDHGAAVCPTAPNLVSPLNTPANRYAVTHLHLQVLTAAELLRLSELVPQVKVKSAYTKPI